LLSFPKKPAIAFLVVIPEGNLRLPLPESTLRERSHHPDFPQKYFKNVAVFWRRKTTIQKPRCHQQSTTNSPQKTITKTPVFSKTP
jgi:hypothetical protein